MKKQPNIVFILTDDQGAWAMHCAGNEEIITPSLDRLASRGVRFSHFFCSSPVCSPARASVMTGKMPSAHGVHDWIAGGNMDTAAFPEAAGHEHFRMPDQGIDYLEGQKTYVEYLAEAGYRCALSGKWHLGNNPCRKQGFSRWFTIGTGGCRYYHGDTFENGRFINETQYITDVITNKALEYLEELGQGDAPFYLSVHYTAPHSPWEAQEHKPEYLKLYETCAFSSVPEEPIHPWQIKTCPIGDTPDKRRENLTGYFAAITAMDAGVGKILDYLDNTGISEDTVVIFTSDNGMNMGHHGVWGKGNGTYPPNMYDSSVKVPFLLYAPFLKDRGIVTERAAGQCDIFPTLLELAGCRYRPEEQQPGRSLVPFLKGEEGEEEEDIFICDEYGFVRMLRTKKEKLVIRYPQGPDAFYDLETDPEERDNRIGDKRYAERIGVMRGQLEEWFAVYCRAPFSGKELPVTGRGQRKRCWEQDAFLPL